MAFGGRVYEKYKVSMCAGVYFLYASCVVRVCRSVRGVYAM